MQQLREHSSDSEPGMPQPAPPKLPRRAHPSHRALHGAAPAAPGSRTEQPGGAHRTQGKLPATLHTTEKVFGVALEYRTNLNIPG